MVYPSTTVTQFFKREGGAPMNLPQSAEHVAARMIEGVLKNKRIVYPNRPFLILSLLHPLTGAMRAFQLVGLKQLKDWLRERIRRGEPTEQNRWDDVPVHLQNM